MVLLIFAQIGLVLWVTLTSMSALFKSSVLVIGYLVVVGLAFGIGGLGARMENSRVLGQQPDD